MQGLFPSIEKQWDYFSYMSKKAVGNNIRELRKRRGWTQVELAERLGCTQGMITAYESGRKYPNIDRTIKLSAVFGVSLDRLVFGGAVPERKDNVQIERPRLWKKFCEIEKLPESERKAVFKMINMALRRRKTDT